MGKCDNCRLRKESAKAFDIHWHGEDDCPYDKCPVPDFPKTHADRIRAMSVEEMAEAFAIACPEGKTVNRCCTYFAKGGRGCHDCWLDWLKQEAAE